MSRLRVAMVVDSLAAWETSRVVVERAIRLPRETFDLRVLCRESGSLRSKLVAAGIAVDVVSQRPRDRVGAAWSTARRLTETKCEVVHLWDDWARRFVGPLLAWRGRTPYVVTVEEAQTPQTWGLRRLDRFVLRRAAQCVPMDGAVELAASGESRSAVLANYGVPPQARVIGAFGPWSLDRNLKDVVWTILLLQIVHPDVHLFLVGEGRRQVDVRRWCEKMQTLERTTFVADPAEFDRLAPHLDVYLDLSRGDRPSPLLSGVQQCGVPVVAVDSQLRRNEIDVDRSGFLVPHHEPGTVTRRVHKLLEDESLRRRMGAAAREFAERDFQSKPSLVSLMETYVQISRIGAKAQRLTG